MTKSMLIFFAMLVVGLAAQPVLAGDEREFIDKTAATTLPNIGMIELHILCDLEFPGTHMCSSGDIVRNGGTLNLQGLSAWGPSESGDREGGKWVIRFRQWCGNFRRRQPILCGLGFGQVGVRRPDIAAKRTLGTGDL
ncbi:MAG: hypothetical protein VCC99_06255 [Alphaproteobacteria bacterium]